MKQYFDTQWHSPPPLHVGDIVQKAYRPHPGESSKLHPKWAGRYMIQNILLYGVLELADNTSKIHSEY